MESQQHALEILMDLRRLVAAHGEFLTTFGQQTRSEENSDSLDEHSPPRRWSPPPSITQELMGFKSYSLSRLSPPRFNGEMALDWICKVQEYYNHHYTSLNDRLYLTKYLFDPPATDWFHNYQKTDIDGSWEDFLVAVYHRFTPELLEGDSHMVDDVHQSEPIVDAPREVMLDSSITDAAPTFCSVDDVSCDAIPKAYNVGVETTHFAPELKDEVSWVDDEKHETTVHLISSGFAVVDHSPPVSSTVTKNRHNFDGEHIAQRDNVDIISCAAIVVANKELVGNISIGRAIPLMRKVSSSGNVVVDGGSNLQGVLVFVLRSGSTRTRQGHETLCFGVMKGVRIFDPGDFENTKTLMFLFHYPP